MSPVASELLSLPSILKFDVNLIFTSILEAICLFRLIGSANSSFDWDFSLRFGFTTTFVVWISWCWAFVDFVFLLLLDQRRCVVADSPKFNSEARFSMKSSKGWLDLCKMLSLRFDWSVSLVLIKFVSSWPLWASIFASSNVILVRFSLDSSRRYFLPSSMSTLILIRFFSVSISRCASSSALRSDTTVWCSARTVSNDWNATVDMCSSWGNGHMCWWCWWCCRCSYWWQWSPIRSI